MEGSKISYQLALVAMGEGQPPATLLRLGQPQNRVSLLVRQVQQLLLPHISMSALKVSCSKLGGMRVLQGRECYWVHKLGGTKRLAKSVNIMTLHTAIKVAKHHGASSATILGMQQLKDPGKFSTQQLPEELLSLNCTPDVNPSSVQVPLPLPSTLPPSPIKALPGRERYGLQKLKPYLAKGVVLSLQLGELKQWVTADYQLDRPGGGIQQVTWETMHSNIMLFLGFCHKYMGVQQPTLQQFLIPHLLGSFTSFHLDKKHSCHTIKHQLQTACKVLAWWATKAGGHDPGLDKLRREWLPTLSSQVGKAVVQPVKSAAALPTAKSLLNTLHQHQQQLVASIPQHDMSANQARAMHNVALASMVFGHLPPIRLSCIRTLMLPSYKGPCLNPDCRHGPLCHGNQLLLGTPQQPGLSLHLPHHKNEKPWGRTPISFKLPKQLAKLIRLHLQGHLLLTEYLGKEGEAHVFIDSMGRPFSNDTFSTYWHKMMVSMGAPAISPSKCRQVFVHERRSHSRVEGPSDSAAAMVMGHSVHQWSKWYDLDFKAREAQQAVDAMTPWREALLSAHEPSQHQQQQQQHPPSSQPHSLVMQEDDIYVDLSDC